MTKKTLNVGMIGYAFMGKAHSNAWRQAQHFFDLPFDVNLHTICGRNQVELEKARTTLGWQHSSNNWQEVVANPEIDIIDINTPNHTHCEIVIAAAKAGKAILCEKPLANTLQEAKLMLEAVKKAGVVNMLCHNYRRVPAIVLAKKLIDQGTIGDRIYHFHARYAQDWLCDEQFPLTWRMDKKTAGSGAHGDIQAHMIDLARYLLGEFKEVCATTETFIKERPLIGDPSKTGKVTVDDAVQMIGRFECGALANLEATRLATGRKNRIVFEINANKGSLRFNFEQMNQLELFEQNSTKETQGFRTIYVTEKEHSYACQYWPTGHLIGYEHTFINTIADFIKGIELKKSPLPNIADGAKTQAVLEMAESSAQSKSWKSLSGL